MIIIASKDKESIKGGNTQVLKRVLENKLQNLKDSLIDMPTEQLECKRGEAKMLREVIKLL